MLRSLNLFDAPHPDFIEELSNWPESDLRRVLRPHWEDPQGIQNPAENEQREKFDALLGFLTSLELAYSTGYLTPVEIGARVTAPVRKLLLGSWAVARFITAYDYFGVRFLAARLGIGIQGLAPMKGPPPLAPEHATIEAFLADTDLALNNSDVQKFQKMLDGFSMCDREEDASAWGGAEFAKWLKGRTMGIDPRWIQGFERIRTQAIEWCTRRAGLYERYDLQYQTRFAVYDFFWIMKLFGAEVSNSGFVTFPRDEWFGRLAKSDSEKKALHAAREVFSEAGSLACTWVRQEPLEVPANEPAQLLDWQSSYLAELHQIARIRRLRNGQPPVSAAPLAASEEFTNAVRVRRNLLGLAFSGGGIRSATFNLGILEGLRDQDLLRRVDYLSTVSGGGYIGSWLVANARRRPFWLGKGADWRDSIEYLRKYSNYLSPQLGLLTADTWNIATIWTRNTILIQLLVFLMIAMVLLVPHCLRLIFEAVAGLEGLLLPVAFVLLIWAVATIGTNLRQPKRKDGSFPTDQGSTQLLAVIPLLGASFLFAAKMWDQSGSCSVSRPTYSALLLHAWQPWWPAGLVLFGSLCWLSWETCTNSKHRWFPAGICAVVSLAVLYAEFCGVMLLLLNWRDLSLDNPAWEGGVWYATAFGPVLVLLSFTLTLVVLLGLLSRTSDEDKREWWSRLGAWQSIYAAACLFVALGGLFAPLWVATAMQHWKISFTGAIGWAATTIGGLLAGKGASTGAKGDMTSAEKAQEWLARLAPVVFIIGLVMGLASVLHAILLYVSPGDSRTVDVQDYWKNFDTIPGWLVWSVLGGILLVSILYSLALDVNVFGLNAFYRNRLVRCYLGATRDKDERKPQAFTMFDDDDDLKLTDILDDSILTPYTGPFPIINCALNLGGSSDLALHTRQSDSFTFTPLHAGSWRDKVRFAPLEHGGKAYYGGESRTPKLGDVLSVSGAAASPNMGYHTSPLVAFLLTVFNVRLGWWFPNPSGPAVKHGSPWLSMVPLVQELFGLAGENAGFLNLSDGGHFENLGIYELVRRRCRVIIASDAECDLDLTFEGLGRVIRMCEADFGAKIIIDVSSIRKNPETGFSASHCAVGRIEYDDGTWGNLIYMKASLTGDEETSVKQYKSSHPDFPHETTLDQFFTDDQFESYRLLGLNVAQQTFRDVVDLSADVVEIARDLGSIWAPGLAADGKFVAHAEALSKLWWELQVDAELQFLGKELFSGLPTEDVNANQKKRAFYYCSQVIQLMEGVYLDLRLDDNWDHPDNAGWRDLFERWAGSKTFHEIWIESRSTYGERFRQFCGRKLELPLQEKI
jgi:hypothetical protein